MIVLKEKPKQNEIRSPIKRIGFECTPIRNKSDKPVLFGFPNYGDYGYGIFLLDDRSRDYVLKNIQNEKDDFLRSMLWGSLWDSVREAELDPREYVELAIKKLPLEKDLESTDQSVSYDAAGHARSIVSIRSNPLRPSPAAAPAETGQRPQPATQSRKEMPLLTDSRPDFSKMTSAERRAYDAERLTRKFG